MKSNHTLYYRASDIPLLFTDIILDSKAYGQFDCRVLQRLDNSTMYLTKRGVKQANELGFRFLEEKFTDNIIKEIKVFNRKIKRIEPPKKLYELKKSNLFKKWLTVEKILKGLCRLYIYSDPPILASLEKVIYDSGHNLNTQIEVLRNPKLANNYNFSKKERRAVKLLLELGKIKLTTHKNSIPWIKTTYDFIKLVAKKHNLSINQAVLLRQAEFKSALRGKPPEVDMLNKRIKGCVLLPSTKKGLWFCQTGKKFEIWQKILEPSKNKIKGDVVYPGKVKGRAKIHLGWVKKSTIPKGSVFICGNTNPRLMPLLKNVSAIVADEGGLTCHAAIISREMKIPCIIGTKIATQILKDGDMVEVDANKGVVKIIKKAK